MDNTSIILFVLFKPCPPSGTRMFVFGLLLTFHHEVWTWLCGCEVAAALIALCLSLLCAWKAFQGGRGGGSLHFLRYCVNLQ